MTSILTNTAAMSSLQSLSVTQRQLSKTQAQISSDLAVASASDNAAYWTVGQQMSAQIFGLKPTNAPWRKAMNVARRVIACVGMPYQPMSGRSDVGVSVGIAVADEGGTRDEFMCRAD